jgi:hypothetical protein
MADTSASPTPTKAIPIVAPIAALLSPAAPAAAMASPAIASPTIASPAIAPLPITSALSFGRPGHWLRTQSDERARRLGMASIDPDAAPRVIRRLLNTATAAENVARTLETLGRSYTVWHDVTADTAHPDRKLDHIVLGPTGLYALRSHDWGAAVRLSKGELHGEGLGRGEKPIRALSRRARAFARDTGVRFSALMIVVPDDAVTAPLTVVRRGRMCPTLLVRRSWLPDVVKSRMSGVSLTAPDALADARIHLQETVHFV